MCYSSMIERNLKVIQSLFPAVIDEESFDRHEALRGLPGSKTPDLSERIYPGHYAPVVTKNEKGLQIRLMQYNVAAPKFIQNPKGLTTYNARRDNIDSAFWSECFTTNHGIVLSKAFFEWVAVKDLLKAGAVTLDQVKQRFEEQSETRRQKILSSGKKYKPTKTELIDPIFRKAVISFEPENSQLMTIPVIFSENASSDPSQLPQNELGFAIVTDEPPPEVAAAGHDRCPVLFNEEQTSKWLETEAHKQKSRSERFEMAKQFQQLLGESKRPSFSHSLDKTA